MWNVLYTNIAYLPLRYIGSYLRTKFQACDVRLATGGEPIISRPMITIVISFGSIQNNGQIFSQHMAKQVAYVVAIHQTFFEE
jgi:hypothetical protein